ncbi:MAG: DUF6069 family protein [Acidimicrobiia bacterium]|nr:DUF6069 family protein [Acidimicrobiia bacterium]
MNADSLFRSAVVGTIAAVIAVVVVYLIADAASGPLLAVPPGGDAAEEIPVGGAISATVIGGLVGTAIAFVSGRTSRPVEVFVGVCVVGLVLYGLFALGQAEDAATGVWLNVLHIAAAIPIVGLLARWLRGRQLITA